MVLGARLKKGAKYLKKLSKRKKREINLLFLVSFHEKRIKLRNFLDFRRIGHDRAYRDV